jgi:hypothetical protein
MKTFSRLSRLIFLGIALILVGNTFDVSAQVSELAVIGKSGEDQEYDPEVVVTSEFQATDNGLAAEGVTLDITTEGLIQSSVTISGNGITDANGVVVVTGKMSEQVRRKASRTAVITAEWSEENKKVSQEFKVTSESGISPATIVVKKPTPISGKNELSVGDSFTQMISIENDAKHRWSTLPLSAWQMDIVFNPLILETQEVTVAGNFLESDGAKSYIYPQTPTAELLAESIARIRVSQVRMDTDPHPPGLGLVPGEEGTLVTIKFKVLAVAEEVLGIHNVQLISCDEDNGIKVSERISYAIKIKDVFVTTHQSIIPEDVNLDGVVDILDLMEVASNIASVPDNPRADVNGDGSVNVQDLVQVYKSDRWGKSKEENEVANLIKPLNNANNPPALAPSITSNVDPATIQSWIDLAQVEDDGSAIFDRGIANLEALLNSKVPTKTRLLLNYPNPFNPETWIPYQLAETTNVVVTIYSVNGTPIRTLSLGHQPAGTYISKGRAAYWDGQNELGEKAASGLYFYMFTAGKFSATGKMLIRK